MICNALKQWIRLCLIAFFLPISFSVAYSQDKQEKNEVTKANNNANNTKYQQNIDSLKRLKVQIEAYTNRGEFQKALEINLKVVELSKIVHGEKHPDYLIDLNNLAQAYSTIGDYQKALELQLMVVGLKREVLGEKNISYLLSLNNLALIYSDLQEYQKALEIFLVVVALKDEFLGEKNASYLRSLSGLAYVYSELGNYPKALEVYGKVVELRKEVLGEKHPDYLKSLNDLSSVYEKQGDYKKAIEINLELAESRKQMQGEKHPDYLNSLNRLVLDYSNLGENIKALEISLKVVELRKEILGENNKDYLTSLNNLAVIYLNLGDYKKSLEINLNVVKLRKEVLGENNSDYINSLINLAWGYTVLGDYLKALEINLNAAELGKVVLGEKDENYIISLGNLSSVYSLLGDYKRALEIALTASKSIKEVLSERHPDYLTSLNNLASIYFDLSDYQKALEINQKVTETRKEVLGEKHPDYFLSLNSLAIVEFELSKFSLAFEHKRIVANETQQRMVDYFGSMTENQRELLWNQYRYSFSLYPMFVEKADSKYSEVICDAYNIALFTKGLLLNTSIDFNQLIAEKGTPEAKAKFEELKLLRLQIQKLNEKPIAEQYLNVDSLENVAQQKENKLVKISKEYGDYTRNLKINWKDVQANLQDKDVAVEFVEYPTLTDTVKYAALVLRKGWQYPKMISLFRKDQIEEFIKQDKNIIYSNKFVGKQIRQLVWEPLEKVVSPGERVYFSPAGIYYQLAIENLAASDSTTLGDIYQMYRLSSTKELVTQTAKSKYKSAVLYGGLQYDLDSAKMVAESKKYSKGENLFALRGYFNDTTVRKGWEYLNGTLHEVEQINHLMNEKQYMVTEYTGETGNEESFKALSGRSPEIIHIATHGFFLPIEESRKNQFMQMRMGDQQEPGSGVDPMLRSGLMLSGGNKAWQGEKIPENIEDGVLTAREISRMDLRGTDLVVLSACETGLGEVSSEGVFGLQRSFKQSGVKNLVMSLWEVNDQATSFMMKEFYTNLLSGEDLRKAFVDAKQKCKQQFPEPQYWAAFILLD